MKIFTDLKQYRAKKKLVLTIGNFDGLHLGHQEILGRVKKEAHSLQVARAVITFEPHPRKVVHPKLNFKRLFPLSQKLSSFVASGIEVCFLIPFNQKTRNLSQEAFLKKVLDPKKVSKVIIGYDFHYGKNREGTPEKMEAYCRAHQIGFARVKAKMLGSAPVSSNRIRQAITAGNLKEATACFGHPYSVVGKVVKGAGIGRKMEIRTANLAVANEIFPPEGVYWVCLRELRKKGQQKKSFLESVSDKKWMGLAYRGPLPAFNPRSNEAILEVFLYQFSGNLYRKYLQVYFLEFVRPPEKVESLEALQKLIRSDIERYASRSLNKIKC